MALSNLATIPAHASTLSQVPAKPPRPETLANSSLHWYAVYTCARHEKAVARHFEERGLSYFLPLYQAIHVWNKRSSRVSLPLFPGYVFVQTNMHDRFKPLQVPGVLHYVSAGTLPCAIASEEIEALRKVLVSSKDVGPHPYMSTGQLVQITSGPLIGLRGTVQRTKSGNRFIVSVEMIKQSIAIEIDGFQIAAVQDAPTPLRFGPMPVSLPALQEQQCV